MSLLYLINIFKHFISSFSAAYIRMIRTIGGSVKMSKRTFVVLVVLLLVCYVMVILTFQHRTMSGNKKSFFTDIKVHQPIRNVLMQSSDHVLAKQLETTNVVFHSKTALVTGIPQWDMEFPHSYDFVTPDNNLLHRIHNYQKLVSLPVFNASRRIPRIVHQMWKTEYVPFQMKAWVSKWRVTNPDWMYVFWTDASSRAFVAKYFKPLLKTYDGLEFGVQKADMFRYIVLYAFGGVYADVDVEPLKSLDPIRDRAPCILSQEPNAHHQILNYRKFGARAELNHTLACNAFMACRPGHPFFFYLLSRVVKVSVGVTGKKCSLRRTLLCTGPEIMSRAVTFYKSSISEHIRNQHPHDNIVVADAEVFLPTFDTTQIKSMKKACRKPKALSALGRDTCLYLKARKFTNNDVTNKSFTNHHWFHTYFRNGSMKNFHISDVIPDARFMRSYTSV